MSSVGFKEGSNLGRQARSNTFELIMISFRNQTKHPLRFFSQLEELHVNGKCLICYPIRLYENSAIFASWLVVKQDAVKGFPVSFKVQVITSRAVVRRSPYGWTKQRIRQARQCALMGLIPRTRDIDHNSIMWFQLCSHRNSIGSFFISKSPSINFIIVVDTTFFLYQWSKCFAVSRAVYPLIDRRHTIRASRDSASIRNGERLVLDISVWSPHNLYSQSFAWKQIGIKNVSVQNF